MPSAGAGEQAGAGAGRRHIVLVGLPGSGKTAVGKLVAAALGAPFMDLDARVEEEAGKPIPRIFAEDGEEAFRGLERAVGREALSGPASVIATGGGFFVGRENRRTASAGLVVYLKLTPAAAARRLGERSGRPLLDGARVAEGLERLLAEREPFYRLAAHVVEADAGPAEAVAQAVVRLARTGGGW